MRPLLFLALSIPLAACTGGGITTYDDTGDVVTQTPNIIVGTESVDFGSAADVGMRLSSTISIQNTGNGPLNISDVSVDSPFSPGLTSFIVNPGASTQLSVNFDPSDYGDAVATLVISSDDPDQPEGRGQSRSLPRACLAAVAAH